MNCAAEQLIEELHLFNSRCYECDSHVAVERLWRALLSKERALRAERKAHEEQLKIVESRANAIQAQYEVLKQAADDGTLERL